uniref:Uncharacterized protein n=1 Tax=Geospiza parvula TaxID=87175 RepID=A0A8C3N3G1_GEOPR
MGLLSHKGAVLAGEVGAPVQLHHDKGLGLPISFPWEGQGGHAGALPSLEDCLAFRLSLCCAELPLPLDALPGPGTAQGFLRETLPVTHQPGRETLPKFWCKACTRTGVTCATYIVSTAKLQPEVRQGGFSILNSCVLRAFPGTAERRAKEDAGTLSCGMPKGFFPFYESADVEVIITPVGPGTFSPHSFTPCVTGTRGPSGTRCIHPSPASATPTLSPDAPPGTGGTFRYFPVLAGLQLLALLAMSAAVPAGTPRPRPAPLDPRLPRSRRRGQGEPHRGRAGPFLLSPPASIKPS